MPRPDERPKMIQELLAKAGRLLDEAAAIADEIQTEITFRGLRYTPSQVVSGRWGGPQEEEWQSSGGMNC